MSKAERARKAVVAAHKAAGTYVPVRLVSHNVATVICQQARIPRDRKSLFFESSASLEAKTTTRDPSAEVHHLAPSTPTPRRVVGVAHQTDASATLAPPKIVSPSGEEIVFRARQAFRAASLAYFKRAASAV